jgi:hypothetical protein
MNTPHFYASREFPKEPELQNEIASTSIILLLKKKSDGYSNLFSKKKKTQICNHIVACSKLYIGEPCTKKRVDSI